MQITDTIADLLTRIRNANAAKHDSVEIPASNLKKSICQILADEGYIKGFNVIEDGKQGIIKVTLRYLDGKTPVMVCAAYPSPACVFTAMQKTCRR